MIAKIHFLILATIIPWVHMACCRQPTIEEVKEKVRTADTCKITDTRLDIEKHQRLMILGEISSIGEIRTVTRLVLSDREVLRQLAESICFTGKTYGDGAFSAAEHTILTFLRNDTTILSVTILGADDDDHYCIGVFYFPDSGRGLTVQCAIGLHEMVRQLIDNK